MQLYCGDCIEFLKNIKDSSIDLVVTDPPYKFLDNAGGGVFGSKRRKYHHEILFNTSSERLRINANSVDRKTKVKPLSNGIENIILDELKRVMKKINIYIWCNKDQLYQYLNYFKDYNIDLLTWHKTNPIPTCNGTYLSDTEYLLFFRESGVKVFGDYNTKKKYYVSPTNKKDKEKYQHPTIKPLDITKNLIINSSIENQTVLDPFMGSGTTGVACKALNRNFIGMEIEKKYFDIAKNRIENVNEQMKMF